MKKEIKFTEQTKNIALDYIKGKSKETLKDKYHNDILKFIKSLKETN